MRIEQTAWKNSVGVRVLLVWQRDCHHIKIARVLNKTETCTIYTCQREEEAGRQRRPDTENFHSHVGAAWCEVQVFGASRQVEFREVTRTACSHDRGFECCFGLGEMSHLYTGAPLKCGSFEKNTDPCDPGQGKKEKETKMLEWHDNQENSQQRYYRAFSQQYLTMNTNGAKSDVVA